MKRRHRPVRHLAKQREMKLIDMEMQNVKFVSEPAYPIEHQQVIGDRVANIAVETQSGGRTANEFGSGDRIRGRKQRHIVTQANQFIREIANNSLGSTIKLRRHTLHKRRDLRNFHVFDPRGTGRGQPRCADWSASEQI
jgi:hypothetical protein